MESASSDHQARIWNTQNICSSNDRRRPEASVGFQFNGIKLEPQMENEAVKSLDNREQLPLQQTLFHQQQYGTQSFRTGNGLLQGNPQSSEPCSQISSDRSSMASRSSLCNKINLSTPIIAAGFREDQNQFSPRLSKEKMNCGMAMATSTTKPSNHILHHDQTGSYFDERLTQSHKSNHPASSANPAHSPGGYFGGITNALCLHNDKKLYIRSLFEGGSSVDSTTTPPPPQPPQQLLTAAPHHHLSMSSPNMVWLCSSSSSNFDNNEGCVSGITYDKKSINSIRGE